MSHDTAAMHMERYRLQLSEHNALWQSGVQIVTGEDGGSLALADRAGEIISVAKAERKKYRNARDADTRFAAGADVIAMLYNAANEMEGASCHHRRASGAMESMADGGAACEWVLKRRYAGGWLLTAALPCGRRRAGHASEGGGGPVRPPGTQTQHTSLGVLYEPVS